MQQQISEHLPGAYRAHTGSIIYKGLLVSQQQISRSKLLCCYYSNHYIRRTLDLRSLLLGVYCSTQASCARARASYLSCPPTYTARKPPDSATKSQIYTGTYLQNSTSYVIYLARNCFDIHSQNKACTTFTYGIVHDDE